MTSEQLSDKDRAEIHDALSHPKRNAILKALSEGPLGFAELKTKMGIDSSGTLQFHLLKMNGLITKELGNYCLTEKGRAGLLLLQPMEKYTEDVRFREQIGILIRALRSDSEGLREVVIVQISLLGSNAIPYLASALVQARKEIADSSGGGYYGRNNDGPENAIKGIVRALGIISAPSTVADLSTTLPRSEAFESLAKIGNKPALDAIIQSIPDWYCQNVKRSRGAMSKNFGLTYEDEETSSKVDNFARNIMSYFDEEGQRALELALDNGTFIGKQVIARFLAVIGDDKSIPPLTVALEKEGFATKTEAAKALKRLKATDAVDKIVNELLKTETLLSTSRDGNSDFDYSNAQYACKAFVDAVLELGSINDWITIAFARPRNEDYSRPFDKAIIQAKDKAIPALTKLIQAPDESIQKAAAEMIYKIKSGDDNRSSYY